VTCGAAVSASVWQMRHPSGERRPASGDVEVAAELEERVMSQPFKGKINVDIRDSVPDWSPFEPPKAPEGAPNVICV